MQRAARAAAEPVDVQPLAAGVPRARGEVEQHEQEDDVDQADTAAVRLVFCLLCCRVVGGCRCGGGGAATLIKQVAEVVGFEVF